MSKSVWDYAPAEIGEVKFSGVTNSMRCVRDGKVSVDILMEQTGLNLEVLKSDIEFWVKNYDESKFSSPQDFERFLKITVQKIYNTVVCGNSIYTDNELFLKK